MDIIKILVVDDDQEVCELTRAFLRKKKYCTFGANSADEALEVIRKEQPQLALLDIRLGDSSGLDVLRGIKVLNKSTKVIMVSALNDEESMREAESLGAEGYIAKPFTAEYLNEILLKKIDELGLRAKENK